MKYLSLFLFLLIISSLFFSCDNPADNHSKEIIKQETLTYSVVEYDNYPSQKPIVQVIYKDLDNDLVIDTVQVPWSKSFNYCYSPNSKDFKTNLIVEYNGEKDVALKASIDADQSSDQSRIGNSFIIKVNNTFKLSQ